MGFGISLVFHSFDNPTWYFDGSFFGMLCSTGNSPIKYHVTRLGLLNESQISNLPINFQAIFDGNLLENHI